MPRIRTLLDPAGPPDSTFSDPDETLDRAAFAARVAAAAEVLEAHPPMRICMAVTSDLTSLAVLLAALESAHSVIPMAGGGPLEVPDFAGAVVTPAPGAEAPCTVTPTGGPVTADAEDRLYLRSSGTTGAPKWVVHALARHLRNGDAVIERLGLSPADRVLLPVPIHHSFGLTTAMLPSVVAGASVYLVPRGNPLTMFAAQRSFQPTKMFMVPSQCRSIMALGRNPGRVGLAVVAGDKLGADEAAAFEADHGAIVNLYGSTELGAITAGFPADPPELRHPFTGPPLGGMELALVPTDDPDAAEGAMVMRVRHDNGLLGYGSAETGELTQPADEYWTTGDLVRHHADDRIEVLGRTDFAVNRDGLLVHMADIEACLSRVAGVAQAAVVSAGMTRRGAGLVAFCALEDGSGLDPEAILAAARAGLPARAVPDRLVLKDTLPLLPSGKFDRRALSAEARPLMEQSRLDP